MLNVVEPESAGVGGDVFVLAWLAKEKKLIALNASGRAPSGATPAHLAQRGFTKKMPLHGIDSATVPGAVDGWDVLLKRAGTLTFKETLEPAATLAEQGFAVTERIRNDWIYGAEVLANDPDSVKTYLPNGKIPAPYAVFRNPDLAHTFRLLQTQGRDVFYKGEIAKRSWPKSQALGGTMTLQDLAATHATWETPLTTNYHGYDIYEMPPSTQGFAVLEMMNILEVCAPKLGVNLAALGPRSPEYWHLLVEAKKLAYTDLYAYNGDPGFTQDPRRAPDLESLRRRALRPHRHEEGQHPGAQGRSGGRHGLPDSSRSLGQHGVVHLQRLRQLRLRDHRPGLRLRPERPRRAVLTRSAAVPTSSPRTSARSIRFCRDSS